MRAHKNHASIYVPPGLRCQQLEEPKKSGNSGTQYGERQIREGKNKKGTRRRTGTEGPRVDRIKLQAPARHN